MRGWTRNRWSLAAVGTWVLGAALASPQALAQPASAALPGMPPVTDARNVYSSSAADKISPAVAGDLASRVKQLESELAEAKRLLEVRNAELATLQGGAPVPADGTAAPGATPTEPGATTAETVPEAAPAALKQLRPKLPESEWEAVRGARAALPSWMAKVVSEALQNEVVAHG